MRSSVFITRVGKRRSFIYAASKKYESSSTKRRRCTSSNVAWRINLDKFPRLGIVKPAVKQKIELVQMMKIPYDCRQFDLFIYISDDMLGMK